MGRRLSQRVRNPLSAVRMLGPVLDLLAGCCLRPAFGQAVLGEVASARTALMQVRAGPQVRCAVAVAVVLELERSVPVLVSWGLVAVVQRGDRLLGMARLLAQHVAVHPRKAWFRWAARRLPGGWPPVGLAPALRVQVQAGSQLLGEPHHPPVGDHS